MLYHDRVPVYVGRAGKNNTLGNRLREHRTNQLAGLWDQFSWYGTTGIRNKTSRTEAELRDPPENFNQEVDKAIDLFEAILIRTMHQQLANKQVPGMGNAREVKQADVDDERPVRGVLFEIERQLAPISERLAAIEEQLGGGGGGHRSSSRG